jgi:hypothetical protein
MRLETPKPIFMDSLIKRFFFLIRFSFWLLQGFPISD